MACARQMCSFYSPGILPSRVHTRVAHHEARHLYQVGRGGACRATPEFPHGQASPGRATGVATRGPARWTATARLDARQTDGTVRRFCGTYDITQEEAGGEAPPGVKRARIVGAHVTPE